MFLRSIASYLVVFILCIGSVFIALAINETLMPPAARARDDALISGIYTLELYPYTGFHVQANYHHTGPSLEKQPYDDYDIQTGDLGFFDFSLDNEYPKNKNEFRIIWTGGSGAQGWGARTNDDMMYKRIPKYVNEKLAHCGIEVTMFNLAMAGSKSYQNYIALNRWGHRLHPDMIVSFSGRNDVNVPFNHINDAYSSFSSLNAYVLARRPASDKTPGIIAWLSRTFPRTMEHTNLGTSLRLLFSYDTYFKQANRQYPRLTHKGHYPGGRTSKYLTPAELFFKDVIKADYAHALISIKRDFDGVPVVVAWQPVTQTEWKEAGISQVLGENFYTAWLNELPETLGHNMNKQWYFYDVDSMMKNHPEENTGTHQGNAGQELISRYLAEKLAPVIAKMKKPGCKV